MRPDVHYVRNGDVSLAYQTVGTGPPDLLLVSGFLSNLEYAWEYPAMAKFLERLARSSRLILTDRRGSGLSDRFRDQPTLETMLQDLEVVLDEAASPKTTLFGLWDGCATSILFAATRPERVSALILFGSSPAQTPKEDYPWGWDSVRWEEWLASIREGWGTRAWVVKNARWMAPVLLDDPDQLERWISYTRLSANPSSAETVMRISMETDIRDVLPIVQTPTLVLHRTGDMVEVIEAGKYVASKMPNATFVELPGQDGIPWVGDAESVLSEIERFLQATHAEVRADRRLATVLFTDIVGSTSKAAELGDHGWRELLDQHHAAVRAALAGHHGVEIDTAGDGFFATFEGPAQAVRCAQEIAEVVRSVGLVVRSGVHTGEVEVVGRDVRGIAVHIGARVAATAAPGEVLVSSTVKDLVAGSGLKFEDRGDHELKGVPGAWRLFAVVV
jgi:class 3 adenylate cyclase